MQHQASRHKRNLKVGKYVQMYRAPFLYLPGAPNSLNPPLCAIEKNRVPYAEIKLNPWSKWLYSGWGLDVDGAPRVPTKNPTYMAFGYYTNFCPSQNKKVKPVIVTFFISQFRLLLLEFTSCISDFISKNWENKVRILR